MGTVERMASFRFRVSENKKHRSTIVPAPYTLQQHSQQLNMLATASTVIVTITAFITVPYREFWY